MATLASAQSGLAIWGAWRDEDGGGGGGVVCRLGACATLKTFARFDNSESFSGCSAVVALMRFASALNGSPAARQCRVGQVDVALHLPLSLPSPWTDCANSWAASCLLGRRRRRRRRDERFINIKTMQVVNNWLSDNPLKSPCVFECVCAAHSNRNDNLTWVKYKMFFFWNESYFSKFIIKLRSDFRKNKLHQQSKTGEKGCLGQAKDLEAKK